MIDTKTLDDIARKLAAAMPEGINTFGRDVEKHLRAGLEGTFQRMDLVTRDEYDLQVALLARTREKLEALEQRIHELEGDKM